MDSQIKRGICRWFTGPIRELVQYGLEKGLLTEDDAIYARNQILEVLKMDEYEEPEKDGELTGADLRRSLRYFLTMQLKKDFYRKTVLYTGSV